MKPYFVDVCAQILVGFEFRGVNRSKKYFKDCFSISSISIFNQETALVIRFDARLFMQGNIKDSVSWLSLH